MIKLPNKVINAITLLENAGFEAFAVGGAVRDSLLKKEVEDFDITTNATPFETKKVFSRYTVIETGIKHGTVTVLFHGEPLEITTYRVDGEYKDNRHPENVIFTRNLTDDLARRDFTVNALAYNPRVGLVDPFGGVSDLENRIIKAVGDADKRFNEDALRILRCVRFASTLGFEVEKRTKESVHNNVYLLQNVSAERIFSELKKLICGKNAEKVLLEFSGVITDIIPQLKKSVDFDQKSKYHIYDVYTHTVKSVENAKNDLLVRLSLLYHDCGKPYVCTEDSQGNRHFAGHQEKSASLAEQSLIELKCDSKTIETVKKLVLYHDYRLCPEKKSIKKFLTKVSFSELRLIMEIKYADMYTHEPSFRMSRDTLEQYFSLIDEIEREGACVSLKTLAVKGEDLFEVGIPKDRIMGEILNKLLEMVVEEELPNERNTLLQKAMELFSSR